jgi:hypothetical protein
MRASDLPAAVTLRVEQLDEAWFAVVDTYITLARRDGLPDVVSQLEAIYRAAATAKQATLRPEIRLLNMLLNCAGAAERDALYAAHAAALVRRVPAGGGRTFTQPVAKSAATTHTA